jgi:hypothetical protein
MPNAFINKTLYNNLYSLQLSPVIYNRNPLTAVPATNAETDPIYLLTQFFIHKDPARHAEILHCLKENIRLAAFKKIYLINERLYTQKELQLNNDEFACIEQVIYDGGARMTYKHACNLVKERGLSGYIVITNSDIFFDRTILNVHRTCLSTERSLYALLRFEYNRKQLRLGYCKLFGPRADSQDTWIYHTNYAPDDALMEKIDFMLGKPGCDNVVIYKFYEREYMIYNEPFNVKTYHYHSTQIRNYTALDAVPAPYMRVEPVTTF